MIKSIGALSGWKKYILIGLSILSFVILKAPTYLPTIFAGSFVLAYVVLICFGVFFWLIFEIVVGFLYGILKANIESIIDLKTFTNIFRFLVIPTNLFIYFLTKIIISIGVFANFLTLILNICVLLGMFVFAFYLIDKYYFQQKMQRKVVRAYFLMAYIFLCIYTFMWGAL